MQPSRDLRALCDRIAAAGTAPTAASPLIAAAPVPADREVFIGRRTELAELGLLLTNPEVRLVTILGPGGIGKGSLARRSQGAWATALLRAHG